MLEGEPAFHLRLDRHIETLAELPSDLLDALGPLVHRLSAVSAEGEEGVGSHVEDVVVGPSDGGLVLLCDTDGMGFTRKMIDVMARIIVDQLEPLHIPMYLSVP